MRSRAWSLWLAALGHFYGLFGAFRLQVSIDAVLILAAIVLGIRMIASAPFPAPRG